MAQTQGIPYPAYEHGPVLWAPRLVGCSCGWRPERPTPSLGDTHAAYKRHRRASRGIPNDWGARPLVFGHGDRMGQRV